LLTVVSSPRVTPEVSLQIDQNPPTFLKILSGEGSFSLPQKLLEQFQLGQLLKGQVIQVLSEGTKALLSIEGQKITVQGDFSLKNGQTISAKVEQISPGPVLRIIPDSGRTSGKEILPNNTTETQLKQETTIRISSGKSSPISYFTKHELDFLKFSEGQNYTGQIKNVLGPDNALIQLKNRNFFVHTLGTDTFKPGDLISVSAQKTDNGLFHFRQSDGPVFKPVDAGLIKPYLPSRQPFGEMIAKLSTLAGEITSKSSLLKLNSGETTQLIQTLQFLSPDNGKNPGAQLMKDQVDMSGVNYEAKVKQLLEAGANQGKTMELSRDLKGQLLDIIQKLEDQAVLAKGFSSTQLQTLKEHTQVFRQAVDNIELNQLTNQLARQENQPILLQIPNPYSQENQSIKLYVRPSGDEESGKKGGSKENYNLAFILDLSKLGNVRVDSQISQTRLSVKIQVENQSVASFMDSQFEELSPRLSDLGFETNLTCCVEDKIDMDLENELPSILLQDEARLVDITT
jgi:hypothetical protein